MRKFTEIEELSSENILEVSRKCQYEICIEDIDGYDGLQDAGCLESFLEDAGVKFIDADDTHYIYKLEDITFKVPYEVIDIDEEGYGDSYLIFDLLEVV